MRTFAKIPTEEEVKESQRKRLRELRDREAYYHNRVNDTGEATEKAIAELRLCQTLETSAINLWEEVKRELAEMEKVVNS